MSDLWRVADLQVHSDATALLMNGKAQRPVGPYIEITTRAGNVWFVEVDPKALEPIERGFQ